MAEQLNWEAVPMLSSPLWGVNDDQGTVIALGLTEPIARLIAESPKLLDLLKKMVGWAEYAGEPNGDDLHCEDYMKSKAVIAKAEGRV